MPERHRISKSAGLRQQDRCRPPGRTMTIRNYSLPATAGHEYAAEPSRSQGRSSFFLLFNFFQQKGETMVIKMPKGWTIWQIQSRAFLHVHNMTPIHHSSCFLGQIWPYIKSNLLLRSLSICICSGFRRSRGRPARLTFSRLHFRNLLKRNSIA